jgi:hypothetical protein
MQSGPPLVQWVVALYLVVPAVTLLHEAGHAVAARLRLPGRVRIRLGREPARRVATVGGVEVHVGTLLQPIGITGVCEYEATGMTAADAVVIALAGPAATAVGLLVSIRLLGGVAPGTFPHALVWQATMAQGFSLVLTLLPVRYSERRGSPRFSSDGAVVLDAFRRRSFAVGPSASAAPAAPAPVAILAPSTAASPLCQACGHRRDEHVDLETGRRAGCLGQDFDFQTLTATPRRCSTYVHSRD